MIKLFIKMIQELSKTIKETRKYMFRYFSNGDDLYKIKYFLHLPGYKSVKDIIDGPLSSSPWREEMGYTKVQFYL